ncbi:MAG: site-specific integrase [Bacteroidetes bacterium]|nr:site-specific integrase [Bacteroidota bacterium]
MLEKSFGILFYLKKPKKYVKGTMPIYLRITVDGIAKELSIKRECDPLQWNASAQRVKGTREEARSLNSFIQTLEFAVHEARRKLIEGNAPITARALKDVLIGDNERPVYFLDEFNAHNEQMAALVGTEYALGTLNRFRITFEHTKSYIKWKYNCEDVDLKKLNYEFVMDFAFWLKTVRKCAQNTTLKYLSNLRKIVAKCIRLGKLQHDPFANFKMSKRDVERIALTTDEIQRIAEKNFSIARLSQVRDIFLFSCFSGLAYIDIKNLTRSQIAPGIDGELWIFTSRQKTETASHIPLLPQNRQILERYKDHPYCSMENRALPVLSNQKMNSYLKEIADVCSINKNLTFHLARHTFATTVTLSNGVPIETVSRMLGHTNLKTTQIYAKVLDHKISQDMALLKDKLDIK